jgi:hypothetical protein
MDATLHDDSGHDRRAPRRGRRATDPIDNLATHPAPMVTLGVCAQFLGVRTRQIWKWHRAGLLAVVQFDDRCVRVEIEEFRRFVARARRPIGVS